MSDEKPGSSDSSPKVVKKLTLPDGFRVGILNLDNILKEVADLKLTDTQSIKKELIDRAKECNYVPSSAASEYATALFQEYHRRFGDSKAEKGNKTEIHKHSGS